MGYGVPGVSVSRLDYPTHSRPRYNPTVGIGVYPNLTVKQTRFLRCFEASCSVTQAARWAKIARRTHYDWVEQCPEYVKAFEQAEKVAARTLEDEAVRRAHEGIKKAVRYKGRIVGYETEYSDSLMLALLKGNMPEKFRDRWTGELTGKDGKPLLDLDSVARYMRDDTAPDQ